MNNIDNKTLANANNEAIFNVYSYLANKGEKNPTDGKTTFKQIVEQIRYDYDNGLSEWKPEEVRQLEVLEAAVNSNSDLANSIIGNQHKSDNGLNACTFTAPNGDISVVFRGTGSGEWIDNGEGLSGIPETNVYKTYDENGNVISSEEVHNDYATQQQVEALNWFNEIASKNGWNEETNITISGHSKGGNKAQFVTINSDLVDDCYSFDGQGFSPEALAMFEEKYGYEYGKRRQKIQCFAADNDYVNVLGERLAPEDHIYYFEAPIGDENVIAYHYMDAMLDENGKFNKQTEQGEISEYLENLSKELTEMEPAYRQFATLGIMNICQKTLGEGVPVNGDYVSGAETVAGIGIAVGPLLSNLLGTKDGIEALEEIVSLYGDNLVNGIGQFYDEIGEKYGVEVEAGAIILSSAVLAYVTPIIAKIGRVVVKGAWALSAIKTLSKVLERVSKDIYSKVSKFYKAITNSLTAWYDKHFNNGYQYASANTYIKVDTAKLRAYADRLYAVNKRIAALDRDMDKLYWKVGLFDLWDLIQADALTGYSWRLNRSINYLNDTASEFEAVERSISAQV